MQLGKAAPFKVLADPTNGLCTPGTATFSQTWKCVGGKVYTWDHNTANCAKATRRNLAAHLVGNGTLMDVKEYTCENKIVSGFIMDVFSDEACKTKESYNTGVGIVDDACFSEMKITCAIDNRGKALGTKATIQTYKTGTTTCAEKCTTPDTTTCAEKYVYDSGKCHKSSEMTPSMASAASLSMVAASAFAVVASLMM
jgi:hypothetical protein